MTETETIDGIPPAVVAMFEQITLQLLRQGYQHYSARAILHRIRWHHTVDLGQRDFKCNNNWTPRLSRWLMQKHAHLGDFFEIRASPSPHDMTDYDGPYEGKREGSAQ